jgi:hypothetical protein
MMNIDRSARSADLRRSIEEFQTEMLWRTAVEERIAQSAEFVRVDEIPGDSGDCDMISYSDVDAGRDFPVAVIRFNGNESLTIQALDGQTGEPLWSAEFTHAPFDVIEATAISAARGDL